jgi:two-component system, NarL family, nitrate/nitrite sensor histidine kinase NarX
MKRPLSRWLLIGLAILLIVLYEAFETTWLAETSRDAWIALDVLVLLLFAATAYAALEQWRRAAQSSTEFKDELSRTQEQLSQAYQRQAAVFRISQLFAEAKDEAEVIDLVLRTAMDLLQAKGASYVPLDERSQPQSAVSLGDMPFPVAQAWMEYLASPAIRQQCSSCQNYEQLTVSCPLLKGSYLDAAGVYCLPVRRGEQDFGVLNLYIPTPASLDKESRAFLRTLIDETALALEGVRMRQRAMNTLRTLQSARERADLNGLLSDLLDNLRETLDADYARGTVWDRDSGTPLLTLQRGDLPDKAQHLLDGIVQSVMTSEEPVLLGNVTGDGVSSPGVVALMATPLLAQDQPALGALVVANRRTSEARGQARAFNQSQLATLQIIAGQVSLVLQNINLLAEIEYNTIVQERTRLAREIHDGLAQTLGFLKLKVAQMKNYLRDGEIEVASQTVDALYDTLVDAYQEARQAIDGLRILPSEEGLGGWLRQTAHEFEDTSGIPVLVIEPVAGVDLPPEVHVQLIRIVQEALSNIRKHANAGSVQVSCQEYAGEITLEVRDDGLGFTPQDIPGPSQHGLRGMRERAELIGADFQVVSLGDQGTTVRVSLPVVKESI